MAHFVLQMHAYDCMDNVNFVVRLRDWDDDAEDLENGTMILAGALRGQGADDPMHWLRDLLEGVREHM